MTINALPAKRTDIIELSHVLVPAFYDDPVSMWIMPDDRTRAVHLRQFFGTVTRHHHLAGGGVEVASAGSAIGAGALWAPPPANAPHCASEESSNTRRSRTGIWPSSEVTPLCVVKASGRC